MTDSSNGLFKTTHAERNGTATEKVIFELQEMIHSGDLRPGDRLPPERDLARLLGVSRPTLRDGIGSLVAVGVLQSRRGTGTFVVKDEGSPTLDGNALRLMASLRGFTIAETFEARKSLEMAIAGLAADRATGEQLAQMSEEVAEMFAALDDPAEYLVHDMRFHQTIAAASGNRILTSLMNMLATLLFDVRSKTVSRARDLKESAEMHRNIYSAIRRRDVVAASAAMRDHLLLAEKAQAGEESGEGVSPCATDTPSS